MGLEINPSDVAKQFGEEITQKMAEYFETQLKSEAQTAGRRQRKFKGRNGKIYTYSKYSNTGQLAGNTKISRKGDKAIVSDGTRNNYSSGYHGMYFLVEKQGENAVKRIMKNAQVYAKTLKID